MVYTIQFDMQDRVLCFAISGSIRNHIDLIAKCVMSRIAKSGAENVLLDLRNAGGRPSPARLFIHVLKYSPVHHIRCALIDLRQNHEFVSLYLKLMRHRGHRIEFFDNPDEGWAWLRSNRSKPTSSPRSSAKVRAEQAENIDVSSS